ncbi:MAG: deoxyhypusine synthase [Thermoplasmata archaeon]|jgi:deoxyhypusine synthase|nr:deoxyhypusine synthase [Thermoplasmata archaeon]
MPVKPTPDAEYSWNKPDFFASSVQQVQPTKDVVKLIDMMRDTSAQGRQLGMVCDILRRALEDPERPTVVLATAGTLISTGMRDLFVKMMEAGFIDAWVSTGGCIDDDLYISLGGPVGIGRPSIDNLLLREHMIDRLYDSYIDEDFLRACDGYISYMADDPRIAGPRTSREFTYFLGQAIRDRRRYNDLTPQNDGVLAAVNRFEVPLWLPALTDCSMGIGLCINHWRHTRAGTKKTFFHDPVADNWEITQMKGNSKKSCVIYLGGGVPKNFVNDCEVVCETTEYTDREGHEYAVNITMDRPEFNGLSGSTLEEAQAWGKIHRDATKATCYADVLLAWPIVANYLLATCKPRKLLRPKWQGNELVEMGGRAIGRRDGEFAEAPAPFTPGTGKAKGKAKTVGAKNGKAKGEKAKPIVHGKPGKKVTVKSR